MRQLTVTCNGWASVEVVLTGNDLIITTASPDDSATFQASPGVSGSLELDAQPSTPPVAVAISAGIPEPK